MAKFKHITPQDWEWMASMEGNIYRNPGGFVTVALTEDQYCRIMNELREVDSLIDQSDIEQIAAAVAASKTLKARKYSKTRKSVKG